MFDFDVREISEPRPRDDGARDVFGLDRVQLDTFVCEIPRGPALALSPETSVAATIAAMRGRRRGGAIVVRNHRPIGVVCDRDILAQACGEIDDLRAVPISALMAPCPEALTEDDTAGTALRKMCARRQWHLPIVCGQGLFVGALDLADLSLWLRDRLTLMTIEATLG